MTLVAGLSIGGRPAFIGDLLVSWGLPTKLMLPTRLEEGIYEGVDGSFAAGLAQKIVIVRPYLMVAWAGSVSIIRRLVNHLNSILPALSEEFPGHEDQLLSALNVLPKSVEVVALLIYGSAIYPLCIHTRGFEIDNQRVYLLGTGREMFFEFVQATTGVMPTVETPDGLLARAVMMRFAANALMSQLAGKIGLNQSWGGGFEVACTTNKGFAKVDSILVRCWSLNVDGELGNNGTSFLTHYEGDMLKLTSFGDDNVRTTTVESLIDNSPHSPPRTKVIPEWTVDLFYHVGDGKFISAVQYDSPRSKNHAVFFFDRGELTGWQMDKSRVDRIIEKIRETSITGEQFTISSI
jgi:hypothetical protein